eukprot:2041986-Rhodomonas_salina.3
MERAAATKVCSCSSQRTLRLPEAAQTLTCASLLPGAGSRRGAAEARAGAGARGSKQSERLSLIHISEPTRPRLI